MGSPVIPSVRKSDATAWSTGIAFRNRKRLFKTKEEKMKNQLLSRWLLIMLMLSFALSGCGGGNEEEGDETEGRSSEIIAESEEAETEAESEANGED